MAITNAQQYQQLVNKPANGKRPGYRGIGGYQSGRSRPSSRTSSRSTSTNQGPAGGASAGGNYGGNINPSQTTNIGGGSNRTNRLAEEQRKKEAADLAAAKKRAADKAIADKKAKAIADKKAKAIADKKAKEKKNLSNLGFSLTDKFGNVLKQSSIDKNKVLAMRKLNLMPKGLPGLYGNLISGITGEVPDWAKDFTEEDLMQVATSGPYLSQQKTKADASRFGRGEDLLNRVFEGQSLLDENKLSQSEYERLFPSNITTDRNGEGGDNDASNNQTYVPPIIPKDDTEEEEVVDPRDYTGLAPRFMGSIFDFSGPQFAADGGRVAAQRGGIMSQQGGSIMPRLSDLSGDVSSAEQMLQEINQRLQSAESTLGEGGGGGMFGAGNFGREGMFDIGHPGPGFNTNFNQQPRSPIAGSIQNQRQNSLNLPSSYTPFAGETFNQVPEQFKTGFDEYTKENPIGMGGAAMTSVGLQDGNRVMFSNTASAGAFSDYLKSIGQGVSPIGIRQGAMDGGRMRQMEMMEDEDDPEGGIMDLESGRQMYFLGKLVKKATRAVKKVAKSPLGKAALMYGLGAMGGSYGAGTGFFSGLKGKLFGTAAGKGYSMPGRGIFNKATEGLLGKLGITKGSGSFMPTLKGGIGLGIGVPMALDALGVGKEEDDKMDLDEYYRTQGIDIDAIRNNPNRILARRFMAEGGDAEPVAKKTMPLLDMDGQEMDLRAEGGFVPLGRMERADDVPARLSKNEFVFTADAVRNAGEGDIDKGAEVMYNMMKNLESGGEVSEESQGLDGAREMFQTSQRLEEVL